MSKSTLALKATITKRDQAAVNPDLKARLAELQQHQAADAAEVTAEPGKPDPEPSGKQLKREASALQFSFLTANRNRVVTVFTSNGVRLVGKLRQFDQYCLLLEGHDGADSLIFKSAISTIKRLPATSPESTADAGQTVDRAVVPAVQG